jgi:LmbE family N-acetylglucosaminyl deacetylase
MPAESALDRLCATDASGGRVPRTLVVVAHPDDETIGAGARIAKIAAACTMVQVTDGAPSDRRFVPVAASNLSRAAYARARKEEAVRALALAGVDSSRVICIGVRDQEATFDMVSLAKRLVAIMAELRPEVVMTHAYEGGHPDHDATAFAVQAAAALSSEPGARPPVIIEMTGYHDQGGATVRGEFLPWESAREVVVRLTDQERREKRAMLAAYTTQREVLAPFRIEEERFRLAPCYFFGAPPHGGRLHYERFGFAVAGAMWRAFARSALKKLESAEGMR